LLESVKLKILSLKIALLTKLMSIKCVGDFRSVKRAWNLARLTLKQF